MNTLREFGSARPSTRNAISHEDEQDMHKGSFAVESVSKMEFIDITDTLSREIAAAAKGFTGVCHLYNPHTTAGLTINEGVDPAVQSDIIAALQITVPLQHPYRHEEGNSPAHFMASLMGSSVTVFVDDGRLQLGTWQRIFFTEFDGPRSREVHWRLA